MLARQAPVVAESEVKKMKKTEIIKELKDLKKVLEMSPEEYKKEFLDEKETNNATWACKVGYAKSTINWILNH